MRSISLCFSRLWSIFGYRNDADRCIAVLRVGSKGGQSHSVRCVGLVPRLLHHYLMDATLSSAEANRLQTERLLLKGLSTTIATVTRWQKTQRLRRRILLLRCGINFSDRTGKCTSAKKPHTWNCLNKAKCCRFRTLLKIPAKIYH
jgi:hypothetical protein